MIIDFKQIKYHNKVWPKIYHSCRKHGSNMGCGSTCLSSLGSATVLCVLSRLPRSQGKHGGASTGAGLVGRQQCYKTLLMQNMTEWLQLVKIELENNKRTFSYSVMVWCHDT